MNAAVAVVRTSVFYSIECFAVYQGYQGLIDGNFKPFTARSVNNIVNKGVQYSNLLVHLNLERRGSKKAHKNLSKNSIDALVVIGGDGSLQAP